MNTSNFVQVTSVAVGNSTDSLEHDAKLDPKSSFIVIAFILSGAAWLLLGSILGTIASFKMHMPDWLGDTHGSLLAESVRYISTGWLTAGRRKWVWAFRCGYSRAC